ncbi:MAG: glutaredoxin family protein [Rubrivivax sp.]|nr:glutaredoxin family protein [Rubrivivax sp.]
MLLLLISAASSWWGRQQQRTLGQQVAALALPGDIRMLSSETCAVCTVARRWFTEHRVPFSECLIERDAACRAEHQALRAAGTPVLLVRGQPQLGFSPERIQAALKATVPG